jgi:hypothetical protein
LGGYRGGERIQLGCTERFIVSGSERKYEVVDGAILVTTLVEFCGN